MTYWFGDLPGGWIVRKVKHVCSLQKEKSFDYEAYIGLENIESFSGNYIESSCDVNGPGILFDTGDVLFGKLRPYLSKVWLATFSGAASSEFLVLRPNRNLITSEFLKFSLLSPHFIDRVNSSTFGAKMPRADWRFIGNQWIPIPDLQEQDRIARNLNETMPKLEAQIREALNLAENIKQLRSSLIYSSVTGHTLTSLPQ